MLVRWEYPAQEGTGSTRLSSQVVRKITRVLPLVGVVITTLLCASPVGQVSGVLKCALIERPPRLRLTMCLSPACCMLP